MPTRVIASVLETTAERTARCVAALGDACDLVEIRADGLREIELPPLIARASRPVIVTVRRRRDGGFSDATDEQRRRLLLTALGGGAAYIDVEFNSGLAELSRGEHGARTILSHHGAACRTRELRSLYRAMRDAAPEATLKLVPRATVPAQASAVRELLAEAARDGRDLACFAMGRAGMVTRVLASCWGSWATYGSPRPGAATAPGQLPVHDLTHRYRIDALSSRTRLFALVGSRVAQSPSPAMHNAAYAASGLDACYLAIEADQAAEVLPLIRDPRRGLGLAGLAVTLPLKEELARHCQPADDVARRTGAVNTVRIEADGTWRGFNTDGPAVHALLRRRGFVSDTRVALLGAGGMARAAAAALTAAGARVSVFNRTPERARRLAAELGVESREWAALASVEWDVLINTTPLGTSGELALPAEQLTGRIVVDAVYGPQATPLVAQARRRGLPAVDGFELLVEQAVLQAEILSGVTPDRGIMEHAGRDWLARRG